MGADGSPGMPIGDDPVDVDQKASALITSPDWMVWIEYQV